MNPPGKREGLGFVKDKHPREEQGTSGPFELNFREKVLAFVKILLIGWVGKVYGTMREEKEEEKISLANWKSQLVII